MKAFFIVNANSLIGYGHWMRCVTLAKEIINSVDSCTFITEDKNQDLIVKNEALGIKTLITDLYDKNRFLDLFDKESIVIIDSDNKDLKEMPFQRILKRKSARVAYFTLDTSTQFISDYVISYNAQSSNLKYNLGPNTKRLTELQYSIFRDEFRNIVGKNDPEPIPGNFKVFICFGGSDELDYTNQVIRLLSKYSNTIDRVDVVLGKMNRQHGISENDSLNISVFQSIDTISEIMTSADIGFCGSGNTFYELTLCNKPCWIVPMSMREESSWNYLISNKMAFNLATIDKNINEVKFHSDFMSKVRNPSNYIQNWTQLRNSLNPNGVKLIAEELFS